jgi:ActR/RegA family two-component response regulator
MSYLRLATVDREEGLELLSESTIPYPPCTVRATQMLVIGDDLEPTARQLRGELSGPAHQVLFAGTGRDGLDQFRTHAPDVILLDLRLPDQSGLEVQ